MKLDRKTCAPVATDREQHVKASPICADVIILNVRTAS
jgi:hypothetical protein